MHQQFIEHYNKVFDKKIKLNEKRKNLIDKVKEKYSDDEIKRAITNCIDSEKHIHIKYKTFEYILRLSKKNDNIKRYKDAKPDTDDKGFSGNYNKYSGVNKPTYQNEMKETMAMLREKFKNRN